MANADDRIKRIEDQVRQLRASLNQLTEELKALRAKTEKPVDPTDRN